MDNFDLLVSRARQDLVAEANRIADTDSAYHDVVHGVRPMTLTPTDTRRAIRPRRTLAIAATLAVVAAAVAIGVIATQQAPSTDIKIVPATDGPGSIAQPTATSVQPSTVAETTVPEGIATTSVEPETIPTTEAAPVVTSVYPQIGVAPLEPSTPVAPAASWEGLDLGPLSPRWDPVVLATDREVVVLGGWVGTTAADGTRTQERVGDGAAYDPVNATWRMLPDSGAAFARTTEATRSGGDEQLITIAGPEFAASYNVVTGEVRPIDPPPFNDGRIYNDGTHLFTATMEVPDSITLARLDGGGWTTLPPMGISGFQSVLRVGGHVVVVGGVEGNETGARALMLTETGVASETTWVDLQLPDRNWGNLFATTDGRRLLVWAGYGFAADAQGTGMWLDPADGPWHDLPIIDERWWECSADGVTVPGGIVIDDCGDVVHYRSAENTVTSRPELTMGGNRGGLPMVLLGDHLYRWGEPQYIENPDAPQAIQFGRLALVPA